MPAAWIDPVSGASSPSRARKSVDLPPPFGPSTPIRSPAVELERDAFEDRRAAVTDREPLDPKQAHGQPRFRR